MLKTSDPWFRALDLIAGPDGGVYLADWCDIGECHENDGVHRSSGRIFKVTHGQPTRPAIADVATLDDRELVRLQTDRNEWYVRQARRVLQERAAAGRPMGPVHRGAPDRRTAGARRPAKAPRALGPVRHRRHIATPGCSRSSTTRTSTSAPGPCGSWSMTRRRPRRLSAPLRARAPGERSGLVLLYLASALQKLALADRWAIAEALAARSEFADDPALPLMIWYGIEPAVPEDPARAVALAGSSRMPLLEPLPGAAPDRGPEAGPGPVDRLVALGGAVRQRRPAPRRPDGHGRGASGLAEGPAAAVVGVGPDRAGRQPG